jgi:hypothetical protein
MDVKFGVSYNEKNKDRILENRVLRKTLGHKRQELTRKGRKLHNEKFRDLLR